MAYSDRHYDLIRDDVGIVQLKHDYPGNIEKRLDLVDAKWNRNGL